jgi:predicted transcriptional regulator
MQSKIFGLLDDKLPIISNGNLALSEYYWEMYPNGRTSGNNDVGSSYELKFVAKAGSQTLLVFIASEMADVVRIIATAAVVRDMNNSRYACVLVSSFGYKEKVLAKSLSVYLVNSIDYIRVDGTVRQIKNDKLPIKNKEKPDIHSKKRQKMEIMKDVLHFIRGRDCTGITSIIYKCNLNYNTALKMIDELIKKEYLKVETIENKKTFIVTSKGESFLEAIASFEI